MERTEKEIYERLNKDAAAILAIAIEFGSMTEKGQSLTIIANDIIANVVLLSNKEPEPEPERKRPREPAEFNRMNPRRD